MIPENVKEDLARYEKAREREVQTTNFAEIKSMLRRMADELETVEQRLSMGSSGYVQPHQSIEAYYLEFSQKMNACSYKLVGLIGGQAKIDGKEELIRETEEERDE